MLLTSKGGRHLFFRRKTILVQNMNFDFEKEHEYLQNSAILVVSTGFGDGAFNGKGYGHCLYVPS